MEEQNEAVARIRSLMAASSKILSDTTRKTIESEKTIASVPRLHAETTEDLLEKFGSKTNGYIHHGLISPTSSASISSPVSSPGDGPLQVQSGPYSQISSENAFQEVGNLIEEDTIDSKKESNLKNIGSSLTIDVGSYNNLPSSESNISTNINSNQISIAPTSPIYRDNIAKNMKNSAGTPIGSMNSSTGENSNSFNTTTRQEENSINPLTVTFPFVVKLKGEIHSFDINLHDDEESIAKRISRQFQLSHKLRKEMVHQLRKRQLLIAKNILQLIISHPSSKLRSCFKDIIATSSINQPNQKEDIENDNTLMMTSSFEDKEEKQDFLENSSALLPNYETTTTAMTGAGGRKHSAAGMDNNKIITSSNINNSQKTEDLEIELSNKDEQIANQQRELTAAITELAVIKGEFAHLKKEYEIQKTEKELLEKQQHIRSQYEQGHQEVFRDTIHHREVHENTFDSMPSTIYNDINDEYNGGVNLEDLNENLKTPLKEVGEGGMIQNSRFSSRSNYPSSSNLYKNERSSLAREIRETKDVLNDSHPSSISVGSGSLEGNVFRRHSTGNTSSTKVLKSYGYHRPPLSSGRKGQQKSFLKLPSIHSLKPSPLNSELLDVVKALFLKFTKSDTGGASHMNRAGIRDLCSSTKLVSHELEYKIDFNYQKPLLNYSGEDDDEDGLWQIELIKNTDIDMIYDSVIKSQKAKDLNFERFYLTLEQIACKCYDREIEAFVAKKLQKIANEINLNVSDHSSASELVNHLNGNMDLDTTMYTFLYDDEHKKAIKKEASGFAFAKLIQNHLQPMLQDLQLLQGYSISSTPKNRESENPSSSGRTRPVDNKEGYTFTLDSPTDGQDEGFRTPSNRFLLKETEVEQGLIKGEKLHYLNDLFHSYGERDLSQNGNDYYMNFVSVHQLLLDLQLTPKSIDFAQVYLAFSSCCKFDFYHDLNNDTQKISSSGGQSGNRSGSTKRKRKNKIEQYRRNIWTGESYEVYGLFDFSSFQMFMIQIAPHILNRLVDVKNYDYETCIDALLRHIMSVPQNKLTKPPYVSENFAAGYSSRKSSAPSLSFKV